ncbi:hypothetical protein GOV05_05400 [Candidatus Woesearchaeota archaeon]|nr:hypothetical protein [Candidatus Woesearchaeota archaeon]
MKRQKQNNALFLLGTLIIISLILVIKINALSFLLDPYIDNTTTSSQVVYCYWMPSNDVIQTNITWYNNSNFFSEEIETSNESFLSPVNTKKGELWTCSVKIMNATNSLTQNKTVVIQNSPPTNLYLYNNSINLGNQTIIYEDTSYTFYLNSTDYDEDTVAYSASPTNPLPIGSTLDSGTGEFNWIPDYQDVKRNNITFLVFDIEDAVSSHPFAIFVIGVNDTPFFNPVLADQVLNETQILNYTITGEDEEGDYPLNFTIINDSALPLSINTMSSTQALLYFYQPTDFFDVGNHTITIQINDTANNAYNESFNIEILSINHKPNITYVENKSANQGQNYSIRINATDIYDPLDKLMFSITSINCSLPNPWSIITLENNSANATAMINVTNLTNTHIACRLVNISVSDQKQNDTQTILLDINNVNDAPIIYNISDIDENTNGDDLNNQTTYVATNYVYWVNATDIDKYVNASESWNYTLNESFINMNPSTGRMSFSPNQSHIGNHSILLTVTDNHGLSSTKTFILEVINNSVPTLDNVNLSFTCFEDVSCFIDFNATDVEGDPITYTLNDTTVFSLNQTTGIIDQVILQENLGFHPLRLTITDAKTAYNQYFFNITVNNTNDAPIINKTMWTNNIVVDYEFLINITAYDEDRDGLSGIPLTETLIFTSNDSTHFPITNDGFVNITPSVALVGNYSINITVVDLAGLSDTWIFNISILNKTENPRIITVTPFGPPPTNFSWVNVDGWSNKSTIINVSENNTIHFNVTIFQDPGEGVPTYTYYFDGVIDKESNESHNDKYFDFRSAGYHNFTVSVTNDFYGHATFTWFVNVSNVNRPPILINDLEDLSINKTTTNEGHLLTDFSSLPTFYDVDLDLDENGVLSLAESSGLSFSVEYISTPGVVDITFSGASITFDPESDGNVSVAYNVSDGEDTYSMTSNFRQVFYNITYIPEGDIQVPLPVVQTRTVTKPVYYEVEVEKIINQDIITPGTDLEYVNETIKVPIKIYNDGNNSLRGITLFATSNNSEAELSFETEFIEAILPRQEVNTFLIVTPYRNKPNYEITVYANVTDPKFTDKVTILVDSLEKSKGDETLTNTKITYAQDLLSSNPECLELNEALGIIRNNLEKTGNQEAAISRIDEIINMCRYLTSTKQPLDEKPEIIRVDFERLRLNKPVFYSTLLAGSIILLSLAYSIIYSNKKDEE